jgi:acyl carrier protein
VLKGYGREGNTMKQEEVIALLFDIITEIAPELDLNDVDPDIPLRDQLELDSVDFLGVLMELQDRYGIEVPEEDFIEFETLNRCATYLAPKIEEATA